MNLLHDLPIGKPPEKLNVVIEISKGSANKYEIDKETGQLTLDRVLYSSQVYPVDYGFLPQTHWHDGDPVDVLVLSTFPFQPGTVIPSRPVAVMRMIDSGEKDEKLICVPLDDPRLAHVKDLGDIPPHTLTEVQNFFETYKILQKKTVTIEGIEGHQAAVEVISEAIDLYKQKFPER